MGVLAFKNGKLKNVYSSIKEAAEKEKMTENTIRNLLVNGKDVNGLTFDMTIAGIDYKEKKGKK